MFAVVSVIAAVRAGGRPSELGGVGGGVGVCGARHLAEA
jgi:hypothetical protein